MLYKGTAPIFITTPLKRMEKFTKAAEDAERLGCSSEATMVLRRLKTYKFHTKLSRPSGQITQCAACFAEFLFEGEAAWQAM